MGFTKMNNSSTAFEADVKKTEVSLQKPDDSLEGIFSAVDRKISFDELCDLVSDEIDGFIPKCEEVDNQRFIGGSCAFKVTGFIKKCAITADLYFENYKKEYSKVTMSGALPFSKFTDKSVKSDLAELSKNGGLKVDIEHP